MYYEIPFGLYDILALHVKKQPVFIAPAGRPFSGHPYCFCEKFWKLYCERLLDGQLDVALLPCVENETRNATRAGYCPHGICASTLSCA